MDKVKSKKNIVDLKKPQRKERLVRAGCANPPDIRCQVPDIGCRVVRLTKARVFTTLIILIVLSLPALGVFLAFGLSLKYLAIGMLAVLVTLWLGVIIINTFILMFNSLRKIIYLVIKPLRGQKGLLEAKKKSFKKFLEPLMVIFKTTKRRQIKRHLISNFRDHEPIEGDRISRGAKATSIISNFWKQKRFKCSAITMLVLLALSSTIYYWNATRVRAVAVGIEQQINIVDQIYSTDSDSYLPTDNSLGIIKWEANKYSGATVYFEAVLDCDGVTAAYVALFDTDGNQVSDSEVVSSFSQPTRKRSGPISLDDGKYYTVRIRRHVGSPAYVDFQIARLIIVQSGTKITDTETQIEVGAATSTVQTATTTLSDPKYYYYDEDKFNPAPTAYFQASIKSSSPGASNTGTSSCTSAANIPAAGSDWTSVSNACGTNGSYAQVDIVTDPSDYLEITGFGFSVPTNATINGIMIEMDKDSDKDGGDYGYDDAVYIVKDGSNAGTDHKLGGNWPATEATYYYGSSGDLWDAGPWDGDDISSSTGFGVAIRVADGSGSKSPLAKIDDVRINVFYTDNSSGIAYAQVCAVGGSCITEAFVSAATSSWVLATTSAITLTDDTEYEVRVKTSDGAYPAAIANAKIVLDQTQNTGIDELEMVHHYVNTKISRLNQTWDWYYYINYYDSDNFTYGSFSYVYEVVMKNATSSAEARLGTVSLPLSYINKNFPTYARATSSPLTLVDDTPYQTEIQYVSLSNAWLKIHATGLAPLSISLDQDYAFEVGGATSSATVVTITDGPGGNINTTNDIVIAIATSTVDMRFDPSVTTITRGGDDSTHISASVTYSSDNALCYVTVNTPFSIGDNVTISGLKFTDFNTAANTTGALELYTAGYDASSEAADDKTTVIYGTLTAGEHTLGSQVTNQWSSAYTSTTSIHYRYQLVPDGEGMTIGTTTFNLSGVSGVNTADINGAKLYFDLGGDLFNSSDEAYATTTNSIYSETNLRAILLDASYVYLGGQTNNNNDGYMETLNKVDGTLEWATTTGCYVYSMVDDGDYIYIGGREEFAYNWWVEKRQKSNGLVMWATSTASSSFLPYIYALSADGNGVYAAGYVEEVSGEKDWHIEKLSTITGEVLWATTTSYGTDDRAEEIEIDETYMYVAGNETIDGVGDNWRIEKRRLDDGSLTWAATSSEFGALYALTIDDNYIYVGGGTTTQKRLKNTGDLVWEIEITQMEKIISMSNNGSFLYLSGALDDGSYVDVYYEIRNIVNGALAEGGLIDINLDIISPAQLRRGVDNIADTDYLYISILLNNITDEKGYLEKIGLSDPLIGEYGEVNILGSAGTITFATSTTYQITTTTDFLLELTASSLDTCDQMTIDFNSASTTGVTSGWTIIPTGNPADITHYVLGTIDASNHTLGQAANQWLGGYTSTTSVHFRYSLDPDSTSLTLGTTTISLSGVNGVETVDFSGIKIYKDGNNNGLTDDGGDGDIASTTISTSTSLTATAYSFQRKIWYDGTRYWASYHDDTDNRIEFWYSSDGETWQENASARINMDVNDFSVEADTEHAFIAYNNGGVSVFARHASTTTSYPGNNFSWGIEETVFTGGLVTFKYPVISKDNNNKVWINSFQSGSGDILTNKYSNNANSISSFASGVTVDGDGAENYYSSVVPLADGDMYAAWINNSSDVEGKKYTGGSWGVSAVKIDDGAYTSTQNLSMVSNTTADEAYLVYIDANENVVFQKYSDSSGTWGATSTLSGYSGNYYVTISINSISNNKLYVFWVNSNIMYLKTADPPYVTWSATSSLIESGTNTWLSSAYQSGGGYIPLIYTEGAGSPYDVKFYGKSDTSLIGAGDILVSNGSGSLTFATSTTYTISTTTDFIIELTVANLESGGASTPGIVLEGIAQLEGEIEFESAAGGAGNDQMTMDFSTVESGSCTLNVSESVEEIEHEYQE